MSSTSDDIASSIFNNLNLLMIRRSVRLLCGLSREEIEDFVKKYSGVVIFLLNVLDRTLSANLISRLSDPSIIYLIEEELRTLLIREVARVGGDLDQLMDISSFLDSIDRADPENKIAEFIPRILSSLSLSRLARTRNHFTYMDVLPPDAVEAIVSAMLMRNIHVALGTMIYCSEELMCVMMDNIASFRPSDLSVLPPEIINMRFRKDYSRYLERSINEHLPADIRRKLESLHGIHEQFAAVFTQILEIRNTDLPESSKRNFILEIVFEIMKRIDPGLHEFLLLELTHKGYLNTEDLYILRSFQTAVK